MFRSKSGHTMFRSADSIITAKQLEAALSEHTGIAPNEPYLKQMGMEKLFSRENSNAETLVKDYLATCDVNVSNNFGMTLLHTLVWADRPDLAQLVIESPAFEKINFKFCIPCGMDNMYASALDLAIGQWLDCSPAFNLDFIESLLQHGALAPNPSKKFLNGEFTNTFYPFMVMDNLEGGRSKEEVKNLFCLLHRYNFSIADMESFLNKRLFDTEDDTNNRAQEFSESYGLSIADQKERFTAFNEGLRQLVQQTPVDGKVIVEMTDARLDNGKDTLTLPFDPYDRPCVVM